ncbi:MAG: ComF family protein [Lachnospiraceae bacterium]
MLKNINKQILHIGERASTWLWPEVCPFCGRVSSQGICARCRRRLENIRIQEPRCMKCGKPLRHEEQEYCYDCMHMKHQYTSGYGLWLHRDPVSISIYQFKYHNQRRYGIYYAEELVFCFGRTIRRWKPDLIIPIPLHRKRRKKRGYNQAEIISRRMGEMLGIPVDSQCLIRRICTAPQKMLGHQERRKNLRRAFAVRKSFFPVKTVLLIDDIYTTGSTMDAAAQVLKEKGVEKVYFLTISIGQGN